jgi:PAS domain S-box-containing protein
MFGWTLGEIQGQKNPYIPEALEAESAENLRRLKTEKVLQRYVTRRAARDGDLRTVAITASIYAEFQGDPSGTLEIMRDITLEIAEERRKEMILRVSRSLPEYPDLEGLLDFISREIKQMLDTEGALVILLDEEKQELYFLGAAYDDAERERRAKEIRFRVDELTAGRVIRTGEPLIVNDTTRNAMDYPERDRRFGYHTKNFLLVPLRSGERIIGVLGALNIKSGRFTPAHMELLAMLAGTVALSIENARFSDEIRKAYQEVISLNRARDKAVTHLSHELKTPLSVMAGSLAILERKLSAMPGEGWRPTFTRVARNLDRLRASLGPGCPATLLEPEGGWYAVLRVPATLPEEERVTRLLEERDVLVHPGYFFDFPHEAFLVLSLLAPEAEFSEGTARVLADVVL